MGEKHWDFAPAAPMTATATATYAASETTRRLAPSVARAVTRKAPVHTPTKPAAYEARDVGSRLLDGGKSGGLSISFSDQKRATEARESDANTAAPAVAVATVVKAAAPNRLATTGGRVIAANSSPANAQKARGVAADTTRTPVTP